MHINLTTPTINALHFNFMCCSSHISILRNLYLSWNIKEKINTFVSTPFMKLSIQIKPRACWWIWCILCFSIYWGLQQNFAIKIVENYQSLIHNKLILKFVRNYVRKPTFIDFKRIGLETLLYYRVT